MQRKTWLRKCKQKKARVQPNERAKVYLEFSSAGQKIKEIAQKEIVFAFEARRRRGDCCSTIYDGQDGGEWRGARKGDVQHAD